jgi:molybdenum cofactor cytidylyltransferase
VTRMISAILLAAGASRRMAQPKQLLPWGDTTVLGQVVATFATAGIEDILVVTGGAHQLVEDLVTQLAKKYPVRACFNPNHSQGGMLSSIQTGLAALGSEADATLIGLGDQPQVREMTIRAICAAYFQTDATLVFPSYKNRRGHPWLAGRASWAEMLALPHLTNPRHFINNFSGRIEYVSADESILHDLDTPDDYKKQRP